MVKGRGASLSRSATTADKQAGEQTGGHTRHLQTRRGTFTRTCRPTDGCTYTPAPYLLMCVM